MPNAVEEVQRIGRAYGLDVNEHDADSILWEFTGFPGFWPNSKIPPHWNLRRQVRHYFRLITAERRKHRIAIKSPVQLDFMCELLNAIADRWPDAHWVVRGEYVDEQHLVIEITETNQDVLHRHYPDSFA